MNILQQGCKSLVYTLCFLCFTFAETKAQNNNDLIITEIMADPTPTKGLPEKEYLELYNRSAKSINLNKFVLFYNSTSAVFPDVSIEAGAYAIVTHRNNAREFEPYGKVIGLNNFSLSNTGTTLTLKNVANKTLFSVSYTDKWYTSNKNQGFALEMIDTEYACVEEGNWASSEALLQGTPGSENSVKDSHPDLTPPTLIRYEWLAENSIKLVFSEKLDSLSAISPYAYTSNNNLAIKTIGLESPQNKNIVLTFSWAMQAGALYQLTAHNIADCSGNVLKESSLIIGTPTYADSGEVVLSEILFNPRSSGEDFVEIYNQSSKLITITNWALANADAAGLIANKRNITTKNIVLQPKQFLVLTSDVSAVSREYFKSVKENFLEMSSLPSFPDKNGTVILLNANEKVFDRFDYNENLHHLLIDDKEGISLEKADFTKDSNDPSNWHSAAASEGYATPGYANSQQIPAVESTIFSIEPEIITPDNDGQDDVCTLRFQLDNYNYIANAYVFNANGQLIKTLAQNQLLGVNDQLMWDGKGATHEPVAVGYYVILVEIFNTTGKKQSFKAKVVVGSKF